MGCIGAKSRSSIPIKINENSLKYCLSEIKKQPSASSYRENLSESLRKNLSSQSKIIRCVSYRKLTNIEPEGKNKSIEGYIHRSFLNEKKMRSSNISNDLINIKNIKTNTINVNSNQLTQATKNETNDDNVILSNSQIDLFQIDFIKNALCAHFLFKDLSDDIISEIISNLVLITMNQGFFLFKEGDPGNFFYIVKEGELELIDTNGERKIIRKGESFGELALIQKNLRSCTIRSISDVEVYCLQGDLFKEIVLKMNNMDLKERISFLSENTLFRYLDANQLHDIARNMLKCEFDKGQSISETDIKDSLFIIKQGVISLLNKNSVKCNSINQNFNAFEDNMNNSIIRNNTDKSLTNKSHRNIKNRSNSVISYNNVQINNENDSNSIYDEKIKLREKEYFGLTALLFGELNIRSVKSETYSKCFQITKALMIDILGEDYREKILQGICKDAISRVKMIKILTLDEYFPKVFSLMKIKKFSKGEVVFSTDNHVNRKIILLVEGTIKNSVTGEILATGGDLYGTELLKESEGLDNEIVADSDCYCLETFWSEIISVLNFQIQENKILSFLFRISKLRKITIFKHLPELKLMEFSHIMKKEHFKQGEVIFAEGAQGDKIYLLFKGKVKIVKNKKTIRELDRGNYFGEISILLNQPRSASVVALTNLTIYTISADYFMKNIDQKIMEILKKKMNLLDVYNANLDELYYIGSLGEGKFGTVSLVHDLRNVYAIKAVLRKSAECQKMLIKYFIKERQILLCLDHPFIVKLIKTMKNEDFIFYLMEHINGIVLSKYLEKRKKNRLYNLYETKFIVACLLTVVNYLNFKKIAHRDIKPDNIMIDEKGYLKLIDFGTAIEVKDFTTTITGTPHYIAPEVLLGRGYGYSADYWSIGVTAFEVFYNFYPFGNKAKDPMDVYKEVVKKDLEFPIDIEIEDSLASLIKKLLKKKVSERLCNLEAIKLENFFENFNFSDLQEYLVKPPFMPENQKIDYFSIQKFKYLERINKKKMKTSYVSSDLDDESEIYDPNWADEF